MIASEAVQIIHEAIAEAVEAARVGDDTLCSERWVEAANLALTSDGVDDRVQDKPEAIEVLQALEKNLGEAGRFMDVAVLLWGNGMFDSRPGVVKRVFDAVRDNSKLIILGASSLSKCLGPDVRVMMFDGTTKAAKDVKQGDVLMGDDSKPRNVLAAHSGRGPMYRITPERGEPWTCNDEHILSLRVGAQKICPNSGLPNQRWIKDSIKDIPVKDYVHLSKNVKARLKQFHVGVEFPEKPLPFDPYIYGAWLGDGCATIPSLHTPDGPMSQRWCEYWNSYPGMKAVSLKQKPGKCAAWRASKNTTAKGPNVFSLFMPTSLKDGEKFILQEYLVNSRENRLKLLAGLLDSDGWLEPPNRNSYGFVARSEGLARQVSWLARSLGFASKVFPYVHTIKSIGFSRIYWHTRISGAGVSKIPCLEKPANEPTGVKTMTNTGFKAEPIGEGDYNGFLIDGNHRFLLGDFTVTHNTFSCGVLYYLFWRMDPYWTAVKLAAPSEDHLYTNLFSHLVALHRGAVIPMTDDDANKVKVNETDLFISMDDALPEMRIQGVLCKQSQISAGALRGHKPKPYRKPLHPKYGNSTRLFILIDECTQVSPGAFEDIKTTEASIDPTMDTVKIVMPCNPEGITYKIVQMAEPEEGWDAEQVDTLYSWTSKQGYPVLRLDGKRFENVAQRRTIYPRMLTYEAFLGFLKAGEHSATYWAKGRGFPPLKDNAYTIVPPSWVQTQRGDPIYVGTVSNIASLDTALGGGDKAILAVGRWGEAAGWRKMNGDVEWFVNRADPTQKITKHVCVADQLFQLPKTQSTVQMVQEVMGRCKQMQIPPENVAMDKGGNAAGVWSHAKSFWGDVLGVDSGERASETQVLSDDQMVAYDVYQLKATELWFAAKRWLDPVVCAFLINPIVPTSPLFTELTTRRYHNIKAGKVQVEAKEIYRARNSGVSPDCFVEGTMILTPNGNIPIEKIRIGDMVITPHGPIPVIAIHRTVTKNVATVSCAGKTLSGKPSHKIFTWNRGWVRMDTILLLDELESSCNLSLWNFLALLNTGAKNIGFKTLAATINAGTRMSRKDFFTGLSGSRTLGLFLTGCTFITRMAIGRIIDRRTWNCLPQNSIARYTIPNSGQDLDTRMPFLLDRKRQSLRLGHGTQARRELRGTQKTQSPDGRKENRSNGSRENSHAKDAEKNSCQWQFYPPNTAQNTAHSRIHLRTGNGSMPSVLSAIRIFFAILTEKPKPALASVAESYMPSGVPVYNLTLESHNVYYANGFLVENCADAALLLVEWCRQRGKVLPGIMEKKKEERGDDFQRVSLKNADEPETLGTEAEWQPNRLDE